MALEDLFSTMDDISISLTVSSHSAEQLPDCAVITALPGERALTQPSWTTAMASLLEFQVIVLLDAFSGYMAVSKKKESPM